MRVVVPDATAAAECGSAFFALQFIVILLAMGYQPSYAILQILIFLTNRMALQILPTAPSDFDFAIGNWRVEHRRLSERLAGCDEWVEFDGAMSTHKILGGFGNVEDNLLCFPDGQFRAVALRSYDPVKEQWSIWWLDGRFPGRLDVPVVGRFEDGVGTFFARDTFEGAPIVVRFLWSRINSDELRWEQAFSPDDGSTWETNWTMNFFRQD